MNALSLYNTSWMVSAGFVGQNGDIFPNCSSGRLLLLVWWFFVKIILSMYTANLTASLTVDQLGSSLTSVKDLFSQREYTWGVLPDRHTESLLLNHIDTEYGEIAEGSVQGVPSLAQALDMVRAGKFVLIDEGPVLTYNMKDDCDVYSVGDEFQSFEYAWGLPKASPYRTLLNKYILGYREEGYFDELWKKWGVGDDQCGTNSIGMSVINISTVAGVFYLLALGAVTGFILILLELLYVSWQDSKHFQELPFTAALRLRLALKHQDIVHEWAGIPRREKREQARKKGREEGQQLYHESRDYRSFVPEVQANPARTELLSEEEEEEERSSRVVMEKTSGASAGDLPSSDNKVA